MTWRLVVRPQARTELLDVRRWDEEQRPGLGSEFGQEADRALSLLVRTPEAFQRVHREIRRIRLQRFPYAIYLSQYDEVVVLAVVHGRRHPRRWQSRR
ncbi:MAG: type II toxin-antitoxin system RelE/ParE family toxin [Gemmatimonadales bacterium]|nr:type II toxin-antitoxin system RelE/ParE family toxin [Gemmatimonadales bacterium]